MADERRAAVLKSILAIWVPPCDSVA